MARVSACASHSLSPAKANARTSARAPPPRERWDEAAESRAFVRFSREPPTSGDDSSPRRKTGAAKRGGCENTAPWYARSVSK